MVEKISTYSIISFALGKTFLGVRHEMKVQANACTLRIDIPFLGRLSIVLLGIAK